MKNPFLAGFKRLLLYKINHLSLIIRILRVIKYQRLDILPFQTEISNLYISYVKSEQSDTKIDILSYQDRRILKFTFFDAIPS